MIRVERKRLREYFIRGGWELLEATDVSGFDSRRFLLSPGVLAFGLIVLLGFLSLFSRFALLLLLTELTGLVVLFARTWMIAKRLTIKRLIQKSRSFHENDKVEVIVELRNRSEFAATGIVISDEFRASKNHEVYLAPETMGPRSLVRLVYERACDGGMGVHKVGPLVAKVVDPLGIFEFRVIDESKIELEVYPSVERIPDVPIRPSIEGLRYGNYEVNSRGLSVNFSGVRSYAHGDSLRHVAWRLSTRGRGLLVKEFEKVVGCDVNVVMNVSPHWQVGRSSASTWEYGKDVALSLMQQQIDLGNSVAFYSESIYIDSGVGPDHFHELSRRIAQLEPLSHGERMPLEPVAVLGQYREMYPRGSNIFYITPFNTAELERSEPWLRRLRSEGFTVFTILIDTNTFWIQFLDSISPGLLLGAKLMQGLDEAAARLEAAGIPTIVVQNGKRLRDSFRGVSVMR